MNFIARFLLLAMLWPTLNAGGQGVFSYFNGAARTRLFDVNGPFAATNVYAQMLAGPTANSLQLVGPVVFHIEGFVNGGRVTVPGVPPYQEAYVQMVAWDSTYWGEALSGVPEEQIGRTDIVPVFLTTGIFPEVFFAPRFTQPAVVPPIPEPSIWSLALLSGLLALWRIRRRRTVSR